jgi:thiosulfate/3-mercaptopyruvate sulfurtransferase
MGSGDRSPLVGTAWLSEHLNDPNLRIIDVRRSRYENGRGISFDDHEGYLAGHIPGAVFAGMVADLSDPSHPVPDMLAPPEKFAEAMGRFGVGRDTLVVAYDNMGFPLGSARLWWALKRYGHDRVSVLDGGLRQWQNEHRPTSTEIPVVQPAKFVSKPRPGWLATKQEVADSLGRADTLLVDCLSPELYEGRGDQHLWGQRTGHILGTVNVPYLANIDPALAGASAADRKRILGERRSFTFATSKELADLYAAAGISRDRTVITYCGRGYAAACGLLR